MERRKVARLMNCVQRPSLEWEKLWGGKKRVSRVISIRLRLISTPVTLWFMAPVSPASKLQCSNEQHKKKRWGGESKETEGEKRQGEDFGISAFCLHNFTTFSLQSLETTRTMIIFFASAIKHTPLSSHCMFCYSLPISEEVPGLGNTFVFILLNLVLYPELSHWCEGWHLLRQRSSPHVLCTGRKPLGTFLHIMQHLFI